MWDNIVAGLVANLLFLIGTVLVAYLIVMILRRKRLYRFFSIGEERKVTIYISHFKILPGGAVDAYGQVRSFEGKAIAHSEVMHAQRLTEVFSLPFPGLESQKGILASFRLSDIRCEILPSPFREADVVLDHTVICVGSPGYNTASRLLQKEVQDKVKFSSDNSQIEIFGLPAVTNPKQGVVARFQNKTNTYFYIGGLSEFGTASAVIYLRKHWARLNQVYRDSPNFYVLCEAKGGDIESVTEVSQNSL